MEDFGANYTDAVLVPGDVAAMPSASKGLGAGSGQGQVRGSRSGPARGRSRGGGGVGAAFAGVGGAGWLGAHVVAYAGHDLAEVVQVVVGQGVEQQAADDLDVAGQDAAEEGQSAVGDGDQGGAVVVGAGA